MSLKTLLFPPRAAAFDPASAESFFTTYPVYFNKPLDAIELEDRSPVLASLKENVAEFEHPFRLEGDAYILRTQNALNSSFLFTRKDFAGLIRPYMSSHISGTFLGALAFACVRPDRLVLGYTYRPEHNGLPGSPVRFQQVIAPGLRPREFTSRLLRHPEYHVPTQIRPGIVMDASLVKNYAWALYATSQIGDQR